MGIKITLVKSFAGSSATQLQTLEGLGLKKFGQSRVLMDTASIRGMVFKVRHLVASELVKEEPAKVQRRKPRAVRVRENARNVE